MFAGLGWTFAFIMLTLYVTRLVNSELPEASKRPGMFIAVGTAADTANTFVALAMKAPNHIPADFLGITSVPVGDIFKAVGTAVGIFIWLVALWFCAFSIVSVLNSYKDLHFTLNYWGFIFPNAGLVIALIYIASALQSPVLKGIDSVATIILVIVWIFVAVTNVHAVSQQLILWPGKDEDLEDIEGHAEPREEEQNELHGNSHDQESNSDGVSASITQLCVNVLDTILHLFRNIPLPNSYTHAHIFLYSCIIPAQQLFITMLPRRFSSKRAPHNQFYKFPMRRCCQCSTRARLGEWNPVPPDTHERCYACQHEDCERCVDFWGRKDENVQAKDNYLDFHDEQADAEAERKKVSLCIVEIIERHSKMRKSRPGQNEEGSFEDLQLMKCLSWLNI